MTARVVTAVLALLVVAGAVASLILLRDTGDDYRVRAIFDNAGFVIPGEDVKVAGVRVGTVAAVEVTPESRAAIVLRIDDPGYRDFRADARCEVRPQSLIGERFVECEPTRPRAVGAAPAPPLREITAGPGKGQRLLGVERTGKAVDLDLINDIMRRPYRERFSIILSELGTGVAGRGRDLAAVIRRANPALRELGEVLALLARQNRQLARLAVDSDAVMQPLARERRRVASAIGNIADVATTTASRRADLEASIARLPRFLGELRPTMSRLGGLADELTPVLADLGAVAPDVNRLIGGLGPFADAATPALESLGEAGEVGGPALERALPVVRDTGRLAALTRPVGATAAGLLGSFQRNDGIERAMDFLFYTAAAANGFDEFGHYLRAGLIVNQCSNFAVEPVAGCSANFRRAPSASAARGRRSTSALAPAPLPGSAAPTPTPMPSTADVAPLLDYLLGNDE